MNSPDTTLPQAAAIKPKPIVHGVILFAFCLGFGLLLAFTDEITVDGITARALEDKVRERTRQLEEMTRTDPLTGLFNVRTLHESLTRAVRAAQRRSEPLAVAYLDVNDFKDINDTQGHQRGDEILQKLGAAIKQVSRLEDSCFRYGGDEFCIILPNCREELAAEIYISRLSCELAKVLPGVQLSVGVVQTGPAEFAEPEALIREADRRMYTAKHMMKNLTPG